jgi:large subunit ribosomal protein L1
MNDLPRVIEDARKGRVEYKLDRTAIIHVPLGKASLGCAAGQPTASWKRGKAKPTGLANTSRALTLPRHGPGIKLDLSTATALTAA